MNPVQEKIAVKLTKKEWEFTCTALVSFSRMIPKSKKSKMDIQVELISSEIARQLGEKR